MMNPIQKKLVLGMLGSVLLIGLAIAFLNAGSYIRERDSYIEVGGGKIAYVPRTAEYVRVNGQVRRIVRFASTLSFAEMNCRCPKCCNGYCYVIVSPPIGPTIGPIIILSVLWFAC